MSDSEGDRSNIFDGVKFYLHPRFTLGQLQALTEKIERHGGSVLNDEDEIEEADTILVGEDGDRQVLRDRFYFSKKTWVEDPKFLDRCINQNRYTHDVVRFKGMGGRAPGRSRVNFSEEDDIHLAQFIARAIPDKSAGGRTGGGVYKLLCEPVNGKLRFEWASNHSWQSWLERYRKNQPRFDAMIENILVVDPPNPNGKGQYRLKRNKPIFIDQEDEEDEEEFDLSDDGQASKSRPPVTGRSTLAPPRKKPKSTGDGISERAREKQRRERTAEAQIAGPSGTQRDGESHDQVMQGVDLNDAPFVMEPEDMGFELDLEFPTQATLVEPPSTDRDKRKENPPEKQKVPSRKQDKASGAPLPVKPPTNTQVAVVITEPPPKIFSTPVANEVSPTPKRGPVQSPLSQSSPALSKSARKTPMSSTWPFEEQGQAENNNQLESSSIDIPLPSGRNQALQKQNRGRDKLSSEEVSETPERVESEDQAKSSSTEIPLRMGRKEMPQKQSGKRDRLSSEKAAGTSASDAPYRNTRGRSKSVEPAPLPVPQQRAKKGTQGGRAPVTQVRPIVAQPIVEEDLEMGIDEDAINAHETEAVGIDANAEKADNVEETPTLTARSTTTQANHSIELDEVERALVEAEEEEADSQEKSDSDSDDSVFEAAQAGAKALLSGQPLSSTQSHRSKTPVGSEDTDEVEETIVIDSSRKPKPVQRREEIQLGFRDYSSTTDDAFPSPGTRARKEREQRKESRKRGRYNPPVGTKAEIITRSRTVRGLRA